MCVPYKRDALYFLSHLLYVGYSTILRIPSGVATCSKGFVKYFLRVPQAVGLYCSCHAAQESKGNLQKTYYKTFVTSCLPRLYNFAQFQWATRKDRVMIGVSSLAAAVSGVLTPVMILFYGRLANELIKTGLDCRDLVPGCCNEEAEYEKSHVVTGHRLYKVVHQVVHYLLLTLN